MSALPPGPRPAALRLQPITPADHDWLYHLLVVDAGERWKFRGRTPSPAEFHTELWAGVHTQYVVTSDRQRCGLVGLYHLNLLAGHARLFAVAAPGHGPQVTEAAILLCNWALEEFELRKLIVEAPEYNLDQFRRILAHGTVEGQVTNHEYWRGRYWDLFTVTITAERWKAALGGLPRRARRARSNVSLVDRSVIEGLVEQLWPIDSLSAVELLSALEDRFDATFDYDVLADIDRTDLQLFAAQLTERLNRRD